jgi:hypothetical protein
MTAPGKTTIACPKCTHHVKVEDGKIAFHRLGGKDCEAVGTPVNGFKVTVVDLATGETGEKFVEAGDYILIPFAPCFLASSQHWAKSGTVQLTLKDHKPGVS